MQPWYPLVDQFPLLPAQAAADDSLAPSPGMPRESLGSYLPSGFTGGLGDPASLNAANCAFPTSFSSASRNATRPSAATSLSLSAPAIADHNLNLNLNFGFNFAAARTTHALALQNSFFPPIDTPLDQFHRRTHEPLSPTQFGALEQHDPTATSESFPPLAPLSHPPHPVTATTLVNAISTLAQPLQLPQDFSNIDWATKRSIESTGQTEEPNEVPYDNSNSGGGGGCIGSGNEITCGGSLQTHDMPATSSRKRTRAASYVDDATGPSSSSNKRKSTTAGRQTTNAPRASSRVIVEEWPEIPDSDDLFGSDPFGDVEDELKMFDLTKDDIRPGELVVPGKPKQKEEEDNRIRLAKFECIICMDNASNLTVTHCGMSRSFFFALALVYALCSDDLPLELQVTCSAHNAFTRPCMPKSRRRSVPCADKSSTFDPRMEAQ